MKTDDLQWCEVAMPKGKRVPKWARSAALASDGTVFIPAAVAGNEMSVILCAGYDGTKAMVVGKHAYFPANWIAQEFPDIRDVAEKIQNRVREFFA